MATSEMLKNKSQGFKEGFINLVNLMIETNKEIDAQMKQNEATVAQAQASIAQLHRENDDLAVLKAENETFISKVEEILAE